MFGIFQLNCLFCMVYAAIKVVPELAEELSFFLAAYT